MAVLTKRRTGAFSDADHSGCSASGGIELALDWTSSSACPAAIFRKAGARQAAEPRYATLSKAP